MTTDRGRLLAVEQLITWQEQGRYRLPPAVTTAYELHQAATALPVPGPPPLRHPEDVAAAILDAMRAGEPVDLAGAGRDLLDAQREAEAVAVAGRVAALAASAAGEHAVAAAAAAADAIVTESLQPAYADVLDQARKLAPAVAGLDLAAGGWTASSKARDARGRLAELADQQQLLRDARSRAVQLSGERVEHDAGQQFARFRTPQALTPGYVPNRPLPAPPMPTDPPVAVLLWLVGEGAPAQPWLPTVAEQDQAWDVVFGEAMRQRHGAHVSALAASGVAV